MNHRAQCHFPGDRPVSAVTGEPPPPPHDPGERLLFFWLGEWDLYAFDPMGEINEYMVTHGMFHLQLWHPMARVSVLTASELTANRFEMFPFKGWKLRADTWAEMGDLVRANFMLELPTANEIETAYKSLSSVFVLDIEGAKLPMVDFHSRVSGINVPRRRRTA